MVDSQFIVIFQKHREAKVELRSLEAVHAMLQNLFQTSLEAVLTQGVELQRLFSPLLWLSVI